MKRIIAFCSALLILATLTACGRTENNAEIRQPAQTTKASSNNEGLSIDPYENRNPFEKIKYYIVNPDSAIYPSDLQIVFDESETGYEKSPFTYYTIADETGIKFKIEADPEITGNTEVTEEYYSLPIEEMKTYFVGENLMTDEVKETLINYIGETIRSDIGERIEIEDDDIVTLEKMFAMWIGGTIDCREEKYKTEDEWGKVTVYENKRLFTIDSSRSKEDSRLFALAKIVRKDGSFYYCFVKYNGLAFDNCELDLERLRVKYVDEYVLSDGVEQFIETENMYDNSSPIL